MTIFWNRNDVDKSPASATRRRAAKRNTAGLGLVEMLILLLVLLLLAGLFLVGIRTEAHSNVGIAHQSDAYTRVSNDMRAVQVALECYHIDNNAYPVALPLADFAAHPDALAAAGGRDLTTYQAGYRRGEAFGLTSPIAYLTSAPADRYASGWGDMPHAYYTTQGGGSPGGPVFLLTSPGPDCDYDIQPAEAIDWSQSLAAIREHLMASPLTYDPSNGTTSNGDIWRGSF